ncbi:SDR family NAD(P)-dependent oxidoreductase [Nocardia sp. NPDC050408]|uniref:SDR family NAD(P)-dependent oxidoreductase n=1 Tax=Nocardia sp. NPDC050408 TaxID=3364319 RepID=UPI003799E387
MSDGYSSQQIPVAIVGIASLTPGASDSDTFWQTVLRGQDLLSDVPPTHWLIDDYFDPDPATKDRTYCRRGAFLSDIDFDPTTFGIAPNALPATDTAQLLAMVVAERVLADLGRNSAQEIDRERASVILGTGALDLLRTMSNRLQRPVWLEAMRGLGVAEPEAQAICDRIAEQYVPWQEATFPGVLGNVVAGRIANRFDLHGTNVTIDAACASSLAAISSAVNELALGTADTVITGGVDTLNDISTYMCFSKTPALSPTGDCRPFSDRADGTMLGEAVVMFALKRLADAERDGDRVYAVIRGIGSSSDGKGSAIYAPVPAGQARALRRAYEAAGYGPDTVGLVEAHGTGTRAGDAAEFTALRAVFDATGRADRQWCALGSAKSQFGHTKSAAGAVGLLKAVLAVQHKILPPTLKVEHPNPELDLSTSPLYLNTAARPWIAQPGHPRRASVSSFGFGGTNFHLTLEEYVPADRAPDRSAPWARCVPTELILVGARSAEELLTQARSLGARDGEEFTATAKRSQQEFDPTAAARLAVVARDRAHLADQIVHLARLLAADPTGCHTLPGAVYRFGPADPGRVAWLFSGQGSQYIGMGADLAMSVPLAREAWDRVAETWSTWIEDQPLHDVVFPVPVFDDAARAAQRDLLTATEWAQPALAAQILAQLAVLQGVGMAPDCVGGHSFGELAALHVAGALDEAGLVRAARRRGELMRDSAGIDDPGAMLALAATREEIDALLAERSSDGERTVWVANENGPRQVVVSGNRDAIADLAGAAAAAGITARRLPTAAAFHTPLMAKALDPFRRFLGQLDVSSPQLAVYGNTDARPYPADPDRVRDRLAEHLVTPVLFAAQIEAMYEAGVRTFVEFGAGSVLTGLVGQILGARPHLAVPLDHRDRHGATVFQEGLGTLLTAGIPADLDVLWQPFREPGTGTPPKGRMSVPINGANYASPYPPPGGSAALSPPNPVRGQIHTTPAAIEAMTGPTPVPADSNGSAPSEVSPSGASVDRQWLSAFREAQQQTAEAHADFQRALVEGHRAFLTSLERTTLAALGGKPASATSGTEADRSASEGLNAARFLSDGLHALLENQPPLGADVREGIRTGGTPARHPAPRKAGGVGAAADSHRETGGPAGPGIENLSSAVKPALPVAVGAGRADIADALVGVVAEKTGFPVEVIDPYLELEADLGIDSIKRVEIFSALRGRVPELTGVELDVTELGSLRTVDQIAAAFHAALTAQDDRPASSGDSVASTTDGADSVRAGDQAALTRSVPILVPAPLPGLELPGLRSGAVLVTDDGAGTATQLAQLLRDRGIAARVWAPPDQWDGGEIADSFDLDVRGVVVLSGLRSVASIDDAIAVNQEAFRIVRAAARRIGPDGALITVQDTGGDFGLNGGHGRRSWLGGLAGLARTLRKEWAGVQAKAVDCERGSRDAATLARALADELLGGGSQPDVGLAADGTRRMLTEQTDLAADSVQSVTPSGGVIVVTGGARGVTPHALRAFIETSATDSVFALLGRTRLEPEPEGLADAGTERELRGRLAALAHERGEHVDPIRIAALAGRILAVREIRSTLADLERAGAIARYLPVDVRDSTALRESLNGLRSEFGPVTGLIHAAGVLADGHLVDKTDTQFAAVVDTKVAGLRALLDATADDPLELVCVFSSAAARFGNAGQADYALANEVVAQVASTVQVDRPSCVVRSLAWGPWDGGMVSPELRDHFHSRGIALISPTAGAEAFVREVRGGTGPVRVTLTAGQRPDPFADDVDGGVFGTVRVSRESHPYLADHVVAGRYVLPLAMTAEWFLRATRMRQPGQSTIVLRDLEVVRRVELDCFDGGGRQLHIRGRIAGRDELGLDLVGTDGVAYVRATTASATANRSTRAGSSIAKSGQVGGGIDQAAAYRQPVLFHGLAFRTIQAVESLSAWEAHAEIVGVRALGWTDEPWHTDPAAVDAGLQLALLWAAECSRTRVEDAPADGLAYLPMAIAEARFIAPGPVGPGTRCVVRGAELNSMTASCDVIVVDADGAPVVELVGVCLVRRPDDPSAHRGKKSAAIVAGVGHVG